MFPPSGSIAQRSSCRRPASAQAVRFRRQYSGRTGNMEAWTRRPGGRPYFTSAPPQLLPQYLPDVALRQLFAEVDVPGDLVASEGFAAVLDDVVLGDFWIFEDHVEGYDFAGVLVGLGDGGAFQDARVGGGNGFDFVGVDVETG